MDNSTVTGVVKKFLTDKQFGFIAVEGGGKDVFFHKNSVTGTLPQEGQKVTFQMTEGAKGPQAANVKLCS